ncbi:MAG: hypothetical protein Salg2KO_05670 [Salibacteraceae bacterium]
MKHSILFMMAIAFSAMSLAQYPVVQISDIHFVTQAATGNCDDQTIYLGDTVIVRAKVVADGIEAVPSGIQNAATGHKNFWLQQGNGGPFRGLDVFKNDFINATEDIHNLLAGDSVEVIGVIDDYQGETEIIPLEGQSITLLGQNQPITPTVAPLSDLNDQDRNNLLQTGEKWEGVYIELHNVTVASVDFFSGGSRVSFNVEDQFGNLMNVSDRFRVQKLPSEGGTCVAPNVGDQIDTLRGIVAHSKNNCPGFSGRGYSLYPFKASDYVYGASAPRVFNINRTPLVPSSSDDVTVEADITDNDGNVTSATLYYATGTTGSFSSTAMTISSGETYTADIPAQSDGTLVRWYIVAEDDSGLVTTMPNSDPSTLTYLYRVRNNGLTIYDVQYTPFSAGTSPYVGESVTVTGVVTAGINSSDTGDLGYVYIQQENQLNFAGLPLQPSAVLNALNRGDLVEVEGVVEESFGLTRLTDIASATVVGSGDVDALVISPDTFSQYNSSQEQYESMLVRLEHPTNGEDLFVVEQNADEGTQNNYGEYRVGTDEFNPAEGCRVLVGRSSGSSASSLHVSYVNDSLWAIQSGLMAVDPYVVHYGEYMESITGVLTYSFGAMKLLPRNNHDIVNYGGGDVVAMGAPTNDSACLGDPVMFVNSSSVVADEFLWEFGDGGTSTDKNPMYAYTTAGSYSITMTATNSVDGTSDEIELTEAILIDTSENCGLGIQTQALTQLEVYPNPVNERIFVNLTQGQSSYAYSIKDIQGRTLVNGANKQGTSPIDVSMLKAGTYVLEVSADAGMHASTLIIKQ